MVLGKALQQRIVTLTQLWKLLHTQTYASSRPSLGDWRASVNLDLLRNWVKQLSTVSTELTKSSMYITKLSQWLIALDTTTTTTTTTILRPGLPGWVGCRRISHYGFFWSKHHVPRSSAHADCDARVPCSSPFRWPRADSVVLRQALWVVDHTSSIGLTCCYFNVFNTGTKFKSNQIKSNLFATKHTML